MSVTVLGLLFSPRPELDMQTDSRTAAPTVLRSCSQAAGQAGFGAPPPGTGNRGYDFKKPGEPAYRTFAG